MAAMVQEEHDNASIVSAIQPVLPPAPPAIPMQAPTIAAATQQSAAASATISHLAAAFPALSTKVQLNSILKPKT